MAKAGLFTQEEYTYGVVDPELISTDRGFYAVK